MSLLHLVILAIVQGLTEFLPISSSAHLILVPKLMGAADQGLMIDVGAHAGTLMAVTLFFWRDVLQVLKGVWDFIRRKDTSDARLAFCLCIATIPAVIAGFALMDYQEILMRHIPIIIISSIVWGLALGWFDKVSAQDKTITGDLTWKRALFVGCAQVLALIPGTSRSGITTTAGRYLGFSRLEAARLAMLMSIPITAGAVLAVVVKMLDSQPKPEEFSQFGIVAGLSFVTALITVWGLMRWLKRFNFLPFVIYRLALAVFLIVWFYV